MAADWSKAFYNSAKWRRVRDNVKLKAKGICQRCGKPCRGEVHHIIELTPYNIHNTSITLDSSNLIYLCGDCHNAVHHRFGESKQVSVNYHFDSDGNVIPNKSDF